MIKAAFFDIDGTLVDHEAGGVPASTIASLHALRRKGIKLFVATGRVPSMVGFLEDIFPFDGFVTLNGQHVKKRDGTVLHRMAHHPEDIRRLLPLVHREKFPCLIIEEEECFSVEESEAIARHFRYTNLPVPAVYDASRLENHPVLQFLAYIPMEEAACLNVLPHIEITSAGGNILDVIPKGGGKETGIAAVAAHYGFTREEIMTFGDGVNDVRMLHWAGTGVAMGNGAEEAKAAASYVTGSVGRDGVQNALLHFGVLSQADLKPYSHLRFIPLKK